MVTIMCMLIDTACACGLFQSPFRFCAKLDLHGIFEVLSSKSDDEAKEKMM